MTAPPEAIELRHLRAFVAVAEELSFARAADRLYLSQSALSRQVSGLEKLLGCDLLRRSPHKVELTIAGEALLNRARPLLAEIDAAVQTTRSVGGEMAARIARLWQPVIDVVDSEGSLQGRRAAVESMQANFSPPEGIDVLPVNAGGVSALALSSRVADPARLLYLHGGGYSLGSAYGYRHLAGALAQAADAGVLVPDYRLAPEHPYPAAIDDACTAYRWMLDQGTPPAEIVLAGDSSGGGLAVALLTRLAREGVPSPGGAILMCPWLDLAGELAHGAPPDSLARVRRISATYLAGFPVDDPAVNPLHADLAGLPPLLIQASEDDEFVRDARALAERARSHGVYASLEVYPVEAHVFHLFWSFLPDAADALEAAGAFAREIRQIGQAPTSENARVRRA
jgi:monoterpene epsilon-lactone hydrolase